MMLVLSFDHMWRAWGCTLTLYDDLRKQVVGGYVCALICAGSVHIVLLVDLGEAATPADVRKVWL